MNTLHDFPRPVLPAECHMSVIWSVFGDVVPVSDDDFPYPDVISHVVVPATTER